MKTIKDVKFRKWLREEKNIDDRILLTLGTSGTIGSYKKEYLKKIPRKGLMDKNRWKLR